MYELYDSKKKNDQDELMHYGVLGMKWGVHRTKQHLKTAAKSLDKQQTLQKKRLERLQNGDKNARTMSGKETRLYNKYDKSMEKAYESARKDIERMDKYKTREATKIDRRYGVSVKEKSANKAISKFEKAFDNSAPDKTINESYDKAVKRLSDYYASKGLAHIEKTNLYKKNLKEISKDNAKAGKSYVFNVLLSPAPIVGTQRHYKNLSRLNGVDQTKVNNEYAKAYERASRELKKW